MFESNCFYYEIEHLLKIYSSAYCSLLLNYGCWNAVMKFCYIANIVAA
jgi:hypothetical protein